MNNEPSTSLQSLWQSQPVESRQLSDEEIRVEAMRFQRTVRYRNLLEHVAAQAVLIFFSWYGWTADTWLSKAGAGLIVLGTMYLIFQLYTRAASLPVPLGEDSDGVAESCIDFHRRELERQRMLHRTIWRWYLGPLVPGLVVLFIDRFLEAWARGGMRVIISLAAAVVSVLTFVAIGWVNAARARELEREIDALRTEPAGEKR